MSADIAARVAQLRQEAAAVTGTDHWSRKERHRLTKEADLLEATLPKPRGTTELPQGVDLGPPPVQVREPAQPPPPAPEKKPPAFTREQIEKANATRRANAALRREGKIPPTKSAGPKRWAQYYALHPELAPGQAAPPAAAQPSAQVVHVVRIELAADPALLQALAGLLRRAG